MALINIKVGWVERSETQQIIPNSKQVVKVGFRYLNPTYKNYNVAVRGLAPHSAKNQKTLP
ncbi:hypothetical protein [Dapis sp. BLCC M172]|uniref:hypothetical protein n=1 Tax=Dapis sp. BLCC M172 TaxID=2975281 RepID=UPI003CF03BC7